MKQILMACLAFTAGIFLAVQATMNAQLGLLVKNPVLASVAQYASGLVFSVLLAAMSMTALPAGQSIRQVPAYLWFTGGLFGVLGISLYYFTIPRLGLSAMISLGLTGQLVFSVVAGHYGWLNVATEPMKAKHVLGLACTLAGILLMKLK